MKLSQIIEEINKDTDDDFEFTTLLGWVNRALDLASDVMNYEQRVTLLLEEGVSDYEVPPGMMTLKYVIGSAGRYNQIDLLDQVSTGYKRWGNIIGFQNLTETAIDMYYYSYLPHLENPDDVPSLPFQFHDIPVLYSVSKAKYQDEEPELYSTAFAEFNQRIRELERFVIRNQPPENVKAIYQM
ncbi:phage adaptor protein [Peribacillus frigoritolerans]|uniref:phage adaptor protein n=1 Tax=Peribacillus frigoritolerans TaxID=450367 RepID=UPI003636FEC8